MLCSRSKESSFIMRLFADHACRGSGSACARWSAISCRISTDPIVVFQKMLEDLCPKAHPSKLAFQELTMVSARIYKAKYWWRSPRMVTGRRPGCISPLFESIGLMSPPRAFKASRRTSSRPSSAAPPCVATPRRPPPARRSSGA